MKNYDVFGIGNALVDIQAQVSDALIQEIGSPKGIMNLVDSDFQANLLTKIEEIDLHTVGGGSAANTMVGLANLGGQAMYAGNAHVVNGLHPIPHHLQGNPGFFSHGYIAGAGGQYQNYFLIF